MLGLKMATDPRWVNIVEENVAEILIDHAFCEQKAASNAISLIVKYPEIPELVSAMSEIAIEEMQHFDMVHELIIERGLVLGQERRDPYVGDLVKYMNTGGNREYGLSSKLLVSAMIEARSCERFRLLSEQMKDEKLSKFYRDLMESEARHYITFLNLARKYCPTVDIDARWKDFLEFEAQLMHKYGKQETMHG